MIENCFTAKLGDGCKTLLTPGNCSHLAIDLISCANYTCRCDSGFQSSTDKTFCIKGEMCRFGTLLLSMHS